MKLACVLIVAMFREHLVFLVRLGHTARMASQVNYLSISNRMVGNATAFAFSMRIRTGMSMSASCNIPDPRSSPEVVMSVIA